MVNHGCQHRCVNNDSEEGYRCECNEGFALGSDEKTCQGTHAVVNVILCLNMYVLYMICTCMNGDSI